ncbi:MAG: MBL fold metallo-hydrolase, partial [Lachnospiraceae bacterium]|nr:MBL fold metallo-hydrolase [Lachnospiraceae bacterium]
MLKIHFFNVAEGDSILLEYSGGKTPIRVLIDTGRAFLPESQGSLRSTAAYHLKKLKIDFIDVLILTHLHVDHIQDLPEIM